MLKQLRIDDAASLCGISIRLLSDLENDRCAIGLNKALAITQQLGPYLVAVPKSEQSWVIAAIKSHLYPQTGSDVLVIRRFRVEFFQLTTCPTVLTKVFVHPDPFIPDRPQ